MSARVLWIGGWGIAPSEMEQEVSRLLPVHVHEVRAPEENCLSSLEGFDIICGYSLGSLLLAKHQASLPVSSKVFLFSPILSFTQEGNRGGKVPVRNVRLMQKQLQKNPLETVNSFYQFAQLPYERETLPYAQDSLAWGLEQLVSVVAKPIARATYRIGDNDPLLDHEVIKKEIPRLRVIPNAGHQMANLLASAIDEF